MKKLYPVLFVSLLAFVLIGIKFYPELKNMVASESNKMQNDANINKVNVNSDKESTKHRDKTKEEHFPFNFKTEEEFAQRHSDQFNIVKKMYYAWDYIHNVQGEFEYGAPNTGDMKYVQLNIDFDKKKNRATHKITDDGKVIETQDILLLDGVATLQMVESNIFTKVPITPDNQNNYMIRYNGRITASEWFMLIYNNYPDWNYTAGTKFGIPVYQIKGEISEGKSESLAGPFTMTVAKDTGVLLDLKCYGQNNEVIQSVTVKDIRINQGVPDDVFQLNLSENKEVSNKEYFLSGVGAKAGGDKTGGVDTSGD